jgi:hypothetical protein
VFYVKPADVSPLNWHDVINLMGNSGLFRQKLGFHVDRLNRLAVGPSRSSALHCRRASLMMECEHVFPALYTHLCIQIAGSGQGYVVNLKFAHRSMSLMMFGSAEPKYWCCTPSNQNEPAGDGRVCGPRNESHLTDFCRDLFRSPN